MRLIDTLKVIILASLVGGMVAISGFLILDRLQPGAITIRPGEPRSIQVVIEGAVSEPGTYDVLAGTRLADLIAEAGGLTGQADTSGLNLAGRLGEGDQVIIPSLSPTSQVTVPNSGTPESGDEQGEGEIEPQSPSMSGLININSASAAELDLLPGIGPAIANSIIEFRNFYGPFTSVDQLVEVSGISQAMVDEFRNLVTLGG